MKPLKPMWDDPSEPQSVRELLDAGRGLSVDDYDFDKGLADHMASVAAGTAAPEWAKEILEGGAANGSGVAGAGAGAGAATTIGWIALPIVAAGVVASVLIWSADPAAEPARPAVPTAGTQPQRAAAPAVQAPAEAPRVVDGAELADTVPEPTAELQEVGAGRTIKAPQRVARRRPAGQVAGKAAAPKPAVDDLMARPMAPAPRVEKADGAQQLGGGGADVRPQDQPAGAEASAFARPGDARQDESGQAPAEDLHAKWARGVNADHDPAEDANDARLEREMRMLKVAQAALASNPTRALQLARRGEREYGASMFQAERQHIVILALVELGRTTEARRLAKPYLAKYPNGPFSARVRKALAAARSAK